MTHDLYRKGLPLEDTIMRHPEVSQMDGESSCETVSAEGSEANETVSHQRTATAFGDQHRRVQ
jgi:hypothetical protein